MLAVAAGLAMLAGCGTGDTPLPPKPTVAAPAPASPVDCTNDDSTLRSYDPAQTWPGKGDSDIKARKNPDGSVGRLVVGVSADTYLMAAQSGDGLQLQGFDIDIAKAVATSIFGGKADLGKHLQFKVITAADRIPDLQNGTVDMVVRNMTITCDRWDQVAFSAQYYHATQKMLFRGDQLADRYRDPSDLAGLRICAPLGSTSLSNISKAEPDAIISPAANHTGCLVKLQQGAVDAITGDDTVLAGLAAQDPYAVVPDDQPALESDYGEPYGVAVSKDNPELAAIVNGVLEDLQQSGQWDHFYRRWLADYLPADNLGRTQPTPAYGRS
jgi:polar amino acid transport system substrate-binding protein